MKLMMNNIFLQDHCCQTSVIPDQKMILTYQQLSLENGKHFIPSQQRTWFHRKDVDLLQIELWR